jgi:hypothetical protein
MKNRSPRIWDGVWGWCGLSGCGKPPGPFEGVLLHVGCNEGPISAVGFFLGRVCGLCWRQCEKLNCDYVFVEVAVFVAGSLWVVLL